MHTHTHKHSMELRKHMKHKQESTDLGCESKNNKEQRQQRAQTWAVRAKTTKGSMAAASKAKAALHPRVGPTTPPADQGAKAMLRASTYLPCIRMLLTSALFTLCSNIPVATTNELDVLLSYLKEGYKKFEHQMTLQTAAIEIRKSEDLTHCSHRNSNIRRPYTLQP